MKMKIYLTAVLTLLILISCAPELEDDYVRIDFSKFNEYQLSDLSDIVFSKAVYYAEMSRNGISLDTVAYTENALLKYNGITNYEYDEYSCNLGNDSNLYAVKYDSDSLYFRKIYRQNSLVYGDTLFRIVLTNPDLTDTILTFDSIQFTSILTLSEDSVASYIDSLNNSAKWYKPYRQWQDEIINLYR